MRDCYTSSKLIDFSLFLSFRVGSGIRVGANSGDTLKRNTWTSPNPASPDDGSPSDLSHGHSSSIDFSVSPDRNSATHSTPNATSIRHRLCHKASFSLPSINKTDFADIRKSFEDSRQVNDGIDLPPIPAGVLRDGWNLSRVTERDEPNESVLMRRTLSEMGPALSAFDSSISITSRDLSRSISNHEVRSDSVPVMPGEAGGTASMVTLATDEESIARAVEGVSVMDTPTRSESVNSSQMSGSTIFEDSLDLSTGDAPDSPLPNSRSSASFLSTGQEIPSTNPSTDHEVNPSAPNFRYSTYALPLTSHPHPPPRHPSDHIVIPNLIAIPVAHPPLHNLVNKGSTETMRTDMSTTTEVTGSPFTIPEFRPSRQELNLVKQLNSRRSRSAMGSYKDTEAPKGEGVGVGIGTRRGLRPLQLVDRRHANRMSAPLPAVGDKGKEKENVGSRGPKSSVESRGKTSAGPGKTGRTSKTSNGSGVTGIRV